MTKESNMPIAAVTTVEETRTIKTEKLPDGSFVRTETIVTKAPDEKTLSEHLSVVRPPAPADGRSLFRQIFG
jgi:hypothetical protein